MTNWYRRNKKIKKIVQAKQAKFLTKTLGFCNKCCNKNREYVAAGTATAILFIAELRSPRKPQIQTDNNVTSVVISIRVQLLEHAALL